MLDLFNHFTPRPLFERYAELIPNHAVLKAFPKVPALLDLDVRLRLMDEFEGLQQILSLSNPPIEHLGPPALAAALAREANDRLAEICRRHPDRFPSFIAALPLNDIEASVREADRAIRELGACGIQLFTHVKGVPLSDPSLRPVFAAMAAHDLPIWVHPIRGPQTSDYATEPASEDDIWFMFGWPYETTACMTRLIFSGVFDEFPGLKIITHHGGGMIPFYAGKIKLGFQQIFFGTPERNPIAEKKGLKKPPIEYFRQLYADTAVNGEVDALRCSLAFFGAAHMVLATDAPFDAEHGRGLIRDTLKSIDALGLSPAEREMILSGNARALLKLQGS
jgi:aminocarboxymuconate-semialdehyde decarboxylase